MRKRTVKCLADTIFWYVLYFLPVISYLLFVFCHPGSIATVAPVNFVDFIDSVGFSVLTEGNIVYTSLLEVFGTGGIMPFMDMPAVYQILCWYVTVFIMHLFIDFLLFLPRLAHKWLDSISKD